MDYSRNSSSPVILLTIPHEEPSFQNIQEAWLKYIKEGGIKKMPPGLKKEEENLESSNQSVANWRPDFMFALGMVMDQTGVSNQILMLDMVQQFRWIRYS